MSKIVKILAFLALAISLSSPAAIPVEEISYRVNLQHCLLDYLDEIGVISYTSAHDESHFQDCQKFHDELNATMTTMYKVLKFNLEDALESPAESECLMDIFQHTKFLEYNVIGTTAMQLEVDSYDQLERVLSISKGIFVYATVRCLISQQMLSEMFVDFSVKMTLTDSEYDCIRREVFDRNLIDHVFITDLDEYFDEKFNENLSHFDNSRVISAAIDTKSKRRNFADAEFDTNSDITKEIAITSSDGEFDATTATIESGLNFNGSDLDNLKSADEENDLREGFNEEKFGATTTESAFDENRATLRDFDDFTDKNEEEILEVILKIL